MPELLFGVMPTSTPEHAFKSAPKTPSPLSDITNIDKRHNQVTPRTQPEDNSMTPEGEELTRAPCKLALSPEDSHQAAKLSRRQLKFEDGVSLQAIASTSKEKENNAVVEVFESNPFCEKKENKFVPLLPQRAGGSGGRGGGNKGRKRLEKQKSLPADDSQV
jgi:hypothetical protein